MLKRDVLKYFGSVGKTAEALGYSRQAVYQWPRVVPVTAQYRLEVVTNGVFRVKRKAA